MRGVCVVCVVWNHFSLFERPRSQPQPQNAQAGQHNDQRWPPDDRMPHLAVRGSGGEFVDLVAFYIDMESTDLDQLGSDGVSLCCAATWGNTGLSQCCWMDAIQML